MDFFRSYDSAFKKAYGHTLYVYNMGFISDCISTLRNILNKGYLSPRPKIAFNQHLAAFDLPVLEKLKNISEIILNEFKEFPDKFIWGVANEEHVFFIS